MTAADRPSMDIPSPGVAHNGPNTDIPRVGDTITTAEQYETVRAWFFERGEYLIVRESWRPWIISEDERGDAWAWSWLEEQGPDQREGEGPGGTVVDAEALRLPLTVLYVPGEPSRPPVTDDARADEQRSEYTVQETAAYFAQNVQRVSDRIRSTDYQRSVIDIVSLDSIQGFLDRIARDDLDVFAAGRAETRCMCDWGDSAPPEVNTADIHRPGCPAAGRAETTTDPVGDAYMLGYSAAKNAETTTATTEDIDRLAHSKDVRVYGDYGAGWRDGVKAAAGLLADQPRTRPDVIHLSDPVHGPSYCGEPVTLIEAASDTRPVCQACHRGAMKRVRTGWCPCASSRPQDCKPENWPNSTRHGILRTRPDREALAEHLRARAVDDEARGDRLDTDGTSPEQWDEFYDNALTVSHSINGETLRIEGTPETISAVTLALLTNQPTVADVLDQAADEVPWCAGGTCRACAARMRATLKVHEEPQEAVEPPPPPPEGQTIAEAITEPQPITAKTRAHMFALLGELGIEDADQQRQGMSKVLGREVESRASLTEDEGRAIVMELQARVPAGERP